jgi:hypothetical protein
MTRSDRQTVKLLKDVAKAMANRMWHLQPHTEGGKLYQRVEAEIAKLEAAHGVPGCPGQTFPQEAADPINQVEAGTSVLQHPQPIHRPIASSGDVRIEPGEI